MKRLLWPLLAALAIVALFAACSGGETETKTDSGDGAPDIVEGDGSDSDSLGSASGLLDPLSLTGGLFGLPSAFTSGQATNNGGGPLADFLLAQSDVPGFTRQFSGNFNMNGAELGASGLGDVTVAMAMFMRAEDAGVVHMVMEADDPGFLLDQIQSEAGGLSLADLQDEIAASGLPAGIIDNLRFLDVDGLGTDAFGIGLSFDLKALLEGFAEAFGGSEELSGQEDVPANMDMEMVVFVQGDHVNIVMTFGIGSVAPAAVPLAEKAEAKGQ